jgi:antitoxin component of RelBE/YafQ-DinJ toxin-antitoxin module
VWTTAIAALAILSPSITFHHCHHVLAILTPTNNGMQMGKKRGSSRSPYPSDNSDENRLIHSSFRIEEGVITALMKMSEKRGTSLSGLVNMTLKNYVTSQTYFQELGFIPVSKHLLRRLFSRIPSGYLKVFGKEMGTIAATEYINYFFPKVNSNVLAKFLELWFGRFQSCRYTFDQVHKNHIFHVTHDINLNFSTAIKYMLKALVEPITKTKVEFKELTPNVIVFSFEVQS